MHHATKNYRELEIILTHALLLLGYELYTQTDLIQGENPLCQKTGWPNNQSGSAGEENAKFKTSAKLWSDGSCYIVATTDYI
jgi:hypothetical protein